MRRAETLAQLGTLNAAIQSYNAQYLPKDPLSTRYATLLTRLVSTGFLPAVAPFQADGWGSAFVPDPAGKSPVVAVASPNLSSAAVGGGSSGSSKKGKDTSKGKSGTSGTSGKSGASGKSTDKKSTTKSGKG